MVEAGVPHHISAPAYEIRYLPKVAAAIVFAIALLVLGLGWMAGLDIFKSLDPSYAAMVPSTAISFMLLSSAVFFLRFSRVGAEKYAWWGLAVAIALGAISIADLTVIFLHKANGIDAFLYPYVSEFDQSSMAPATAFCFLFASACIFTLLKPSATNDQLFVAFATIGLFLASIAIIGYMFDADALYEVSIFTAMALHTALGFLVMFVGLLLIRPDVGWAKLLLGSGSGSAGARRLLPLVIFFPLVSCFIALAVTKAGLFNENFRLSLLSLVMMVSLVAMVLRNAVIQNRAEGKLIDTLGQLRATVGDRDLLLREVHHRVKNNLQQINAIIFLETQTVEDSEAKKALRSLAGRVQALSDAHDLLVASESPTQLGTISFLRTLCENVANVFDADKQSISVVVEGHDEQVHVDLATTVGLVVNELVTNALKHGFPEQRQGRVVVRYLKNDDGSTELIVSDDGIGLKKMSSAEMLEGTSAGARMIQGFVKQLNAKIEVDHSDGTTVRIVIPPQPDGTGKPALGRNTDRSFQEGEASRKLKIRQEEKTSSA